MTSLEPPKPSGSETSSHHQLLKASDLRLSKLLSFILGRSRCLAVSLGICRQVVGDQELHGRVDLVAQVVVVLDAHVQLDRVKVNDHTSDFGRVVLADHSVHMLVDGSADDLLARLSGSLSELGRVEHRKDLVLVDRTLVHHSSVNRLALVGYLLGLLGGVARLHLRLLLRHGVARHLLHALRPVRGSLLVRALPWLVLALVLHPTVLLMMAAVGVGTLATTMHSLLASDPIEWLSSIRLSLTAHRHRAHPSLLTSSITNLQLVHQEAK